MADHVDFTFICSHTVRIGQGLPDWDTGGPYEARATRGFIEDVYGPLPKDADLRAIFDDHIAAVAKDAAQRKFKAAKGGLAQPVIVDGGDVPTL